MVHLPATMPSLSSLPQKKNSAEQDGNTTGLKGEFERVLDGIGLDPTNAMRCFAFQIARKESFPFEPSPIEFEMSGKTTVTSFKVADDADAVLQDLGTNFSSAVRLLALQTIAEGAIPFRAGA